jgi:hypothetical protein
LGVVVETRRFHNFAPFVRQTGEKKAQTCAMAILQQLLLALAPRRLLRLPKLGRLIQVIQEEARLPGLVFRETKPKRLLWLAVTQNHNAMAPVQIQPGQASALVLWRRDVQNDALTASQKRSVSCELNPVEIHFGWPTTSLKFSQGNEAPQTFVDVWDARRTALS